MKRFLIVTIVILFAAMQVNAQSANSIGAKIGYINTETILSQIPEYKVAQEKLEVLSNQYKERVDGEVKKIEILYQSYQSSKATLSEQVRVQRENEIINRERSVKELQKTYFGQDGVMQKKSEELLTPIKDKIQQAIDKIAKDGNFMLIFDLAALQGVAYSNANDNLSNLVLKIMGYKLN
ncbi:MAG: OmpH family outer membrane protein [Bacteroidales bacterium]